MTTGPFEPPNGQDDAPDVRTAVHAVIRLLRWVMDKDGELDADDLRRVAATLRAMERLREAL